MKAIRAILISAALLICFLMLLAASPLLLHENVRYGRAVGAHHTEPSAATARELARATAADNRTLLRTELVLGAALVLLFSAIALTSRMMRVQTSNQAM